MNMATSAQIRNQAEHRLLRIAFIYCLIQSLPLTTDLFSAILNIDGLNISYGDLFTFTRLTPRFIPGKESFLNWFSIAGLALIGSFIWEKSIYKDQDFDKLYYWIRVVMRYRLAIGILGYGFLKLFPMQAPYPSLGNLHTGRYG